MSRKILVTGGAGFIGSHLVNRLALKDNDIIVIDNLERGDKSRLIDSNNIHFYERDLRNYNDVEILFKDVDLVVHLASKVGGIGLYLSAPYEIKMANMDIDENVLKASLRYLVRNFFYASSAHIYPRRLQKTPDSPAMKEYEAYPIDCELSYGFSKAMGEKRLEDAEREKYFLNIAIARLIGIYGPDQDYGLETGSAIPVFSHRAIKYPKIPFVVWGTGKETRSYCFIDDAVDAIELMIDGMRDHKKVIVNIGMESRNTITEIAEEIIGISGKDIEIEYDGSKKTKIWGQWCDCSLAEEIYGWRAKVPLREGLKIVYDDVKNRLNGEEVSADAI